MIFFKTTKKVILMTEEHERKLKKQNFVVFVQKVYIPRKAEIIDTRQANTEVQHITNLI